MLRARGLIGALLAVAIAACSSGRFVPPAATGLAASQSSAPAAASTASPGGVPSPDVVFQAVDCPASDVCARVAVARVPAIPLSRPIPCHENGKTCVLTLDLYYPATPRSGGAGYPVVVFAKGGPDVPAPSGNGLVSLLAAQGVVVVDTSWRQGPTFGAPNWSEGLQDVGCAVRAARALSARVGGASDRVIAIGHSLGGWAAAVLALTPREVAPEPECLFDAGALAADGFAGLAGVYGTPSDLVASSGIPKVPILLICGDSDDRLGDSQALAEVLGGAGRPTTVLVEPGIEHQLILTDDATIRALVDLLGST